MPKHIILIAGEASGDMLGASLIKSLRAEAGEAVIFSGIGGEHMINAGLKPILPLEAISSAGFIDVVMRAPRLLWHVRATANEIAKQRPDALIIIDSYDFTHRVARRVHALAPEIPVINYVPPKVWVWRARRARAMKKYIRRCLVVFPFEVEAMRMLEGPEAIYAGHPALERIADKDKGQAFREKHGRGKKILIIAPGSRVVELKHLLGVFGETIQLLSKNFDLQYVMPAAPTVRDLLQQEIADWPVKPILIDDEEEKRAAFRAADAALAASGTVTLELALSDTAFVCAYRLSRIDEWVFSNFIHMDFVSPPNLILDRKAFPEFLGGDVQPLSLASAVGDLLSQSSTFSDDLAALQKKMAVSDQPSRIAAQSVLEIISR